VIQKLPPGTSRFAVCDLESSKWRNGGGSTREIASGCFTDRGPDPDLPWDWRLSLAAIASDGPFSTFAGVDRTAVLVKGRLALATQHCTMELATLGDIRSFPGEAETFATLGGGDAALLNLMFRRGSVAAEVRVWRGNGISEPSPRGSVFFFVAASEFEVGLLSEGASRIVRSDLLLHEGLRFDGGVKRAEFRAASDGACLVELRVRPAVAHSKDTR